MCAQMAAASSGDLDRRVKQRQDVHGAEGLHAAMCHGRTKTGAGCGIYTFPTRTFDVTAPRVCAVRSRRVRFNTVHISCVLIFHPRRGKKITKKQQTLSQLLPSSCFSVQQQLPHIPAPTSPATPLAACIPPPPPFPTPPSPHPNSLSWPVAMEADWEDGSVSPARCPSISAGRKHLRHRLKIKTSDPKKKKKTQ